MLCGIGALWEGRGDELLLPQSALAEMPLWMGKVWKNNFLTYLSKGCVAFCWHKTKEVPKNEPKNELGI